MMLRTKGPGSKTPTNRPTTSNPPAGTSRNKKTPGNLPGVCHWLDDCGTARRQYMISHHNLLRRLGSRAATLRGRSTPLFGQALKNVRAFVADNFLAFGHGANQTAEDWQAAQRQVRAAIVYADLNVHLVERFVRREIFDAKFAIRASRHHAKDFFVRHAFLVAPGGVR